MILTLIAQPVASSAKVLHRVGAVVSGFHKGASVAALSAAILLGGCNAQHAKEAGGAIGTVLGVVVGAAIGGNSDMGAAGGALFGGVAGFIAGSMVGQVIEDVDRAKQQEATQAALNGNGSTIYWASPKNPTTVYGRTEILGTRTVPTTATSAPAGQTVTVPVSEASNSGLVVYCDPGNGRPYRLEAQRCPSNGSVVEISRERYLAMVPDAGPAPAIQGQHENSASKRSRAKNADKPARVQTASVPVEKAPRPTSAVEPLPPQMETVCKTAREVVYVDGKEQADQVEYCRAPGAVGWTRRAA